ncbi:hypothetical protein ACFL15_00755 [Patescibacteria group bacterium]
MKKIFNKLLFILGIIIPLMLGFRFLFSTNQLVWGDAPFFYKEGLKELFFEPYSWVERGNTLGGINSFLWLSPWMVLYGALGTVFNLGNSEIIRIIFYFPSLSLSVLGTYLLGKYLKFSKVILFFSSIFYVFNTYYLLIVDGGQVGIALAYGLFPFLILYLKKLFDKQNAANFFLALLFSFIVTSVDPRFYVIGFITVILWQVFESIFKKDISIIKGILYLVLSFLILIPLSFYWINPYFKLGVPNLSTEVVSLQLNSFLNTLFLYQPHWYLNVYGKVTYPPFYFILIPISIFSNLFLKEKKKTLPLIGTFLVLAFIAKGSTPPFEELFNFFIKNVPFAEVFRDSSKFFTPLILFGGILIANTIDSLNKKNTKNFIILFSFVYILFFVNPLFSEKLKWNLSNRNNTNLDQIYELIKNDQEDYFRTAWFYEKPPLAFETREKPSLNAKDLISFRPFSSLNVGSYDSLNFMHQGNWQDWFRLLGIKYLVFSGNQRQLDITDNELSDWNEFLEFTDTQEGVEKVGTIDNLPVYALDNLTPKVFGLEKLFIVVGSDDVYEKIENVNPNFSRSNQGFVFVEDGMYDISSLKDVSFESAVIVFNLKAKNDLVLSSLKEKFTNPISYKNSQWSLWSEDKYLEWKFQLLTRGVETREFDYKKGIAFSTQPGEEINYTFPIPEDGEYIPAFRIMEALDSEGVQISYQGRKQTHESSDNYQFNWYIDEPIFLDKGKLSISIENLGGLNVINTFTFIPKDDFDNATVLIEELMSAYQVIDLSNSNEIIKLSSLINNQNWKEIEYTNEKILFFGFPEITEDINWIVLSQKYDPNWQLLRGDLVYESLPFYSMINGFYVDNKWQKFSIEFKGQEYFRWGVYVTVISTLLSIIVFIILQDERKNN